MKTDSSSNVAPDNKLLSGVTFLIRKHFGEVSSSQAEDPIRDAFEHHFQAPGKQMRAALSLDASQALGLDSHTSECLAACVEALHNASLVLDDFQDSALERRGQPTVCAQYGRDVALGLTLRLTTTAFVSLSQIKNVEHLASLTMEVHQAVADTILGQTWDQDDTKNEAVEQVKLTASMKSGPLFGLSLSLPLLAAGHKDALETARRLGKLFGLGYQALDDLKDRAADRLQAVDANIVNAFESDLSFVEAEMAAQEIADSVLNEALALATELPKQSGAGIGKLIKQVRQSCT
jgi:geranylgeranyl pyrophosphate synthase